MKGTIIAVLVVVVSLVTIPIVTQAAHDAQVNDYSENFANVNTGVGETDATVTLTYDHFHSDCTDITVTSDNASDTPACANYNDTNRTVRVSGLQESATRTLTVNYEIDALSSYGGASSLLGLVPLVWVAGAIILALAIVVGSRRRESGI